jgi:hypothetical protein
LTPKQIFIARCWESTLALGQILVAFSIGSTLITAVAEVGDVEFDGVRDEALIPCLVSTGLSIFVLGLAFALNDTFYLLCQKDKKSSNNEGGGEEEEEQTTS